MNRALFVELFGDIFEHSPWIAERTYDAGLTTGQDTAEGLRRHGCKCSPRRRGAEARAHQRSIPISPGGWIADLTADSRSEQSSAGLYTLTAEERDRFLDAQRRL